MPLSPLATDVFATSTRLLLLTLQSGRSFWVAADDTVFLALGGLCPGAYVAALTAEIAPVRAGEVELGARLIFNNRVEVLTSIR